MRGAFADRFYGFLKQLTNAVVGDHLVTAWFDYQVSGEPLKPQAEVRGENSFLMVDC